MRLKKILKNLDIMESKNFKDYNIKAITHISKDVIKDSIFICIKGNNFNGNDYIIDAIKSGAKCIVTEEECNATNVCVIRVKDVRLAMSVLAKNFYNNACDSMQIIGIIGTCGKTSTSMIIAKLLQNSDNNIGIIGTNGIFIGDIKLDNKFTTPDPLELHYIFYQMKLLGVKTVVMEVSAQAIYLNKMYGVKLDIGVFTNISEEHLDFFGTMEKYARCKMDYFDLSNMKECVVNVDDFYGMEIAYKTKVPCVSYAVKNPANSFALDIQIDINSTKFTANILDNIIKVDSKLVGDFNVYNILAAMTVAKMLGVSCEDIGNKINSINGIAGRLNFFEKNGRQIIVDFAHTPDSFDKTLSFVKKFCRSRLITLFGCVGYSDQEKRYQMGAIADKYSDEIILSVDNRGNTLFEDICADIITGISHAKYTLIEDRKVAIKSGIEKLSGGDILCVLGKGAEDFQKIGDERIPYSDLQVVEEYIKG